jgi:hypothetical protein
MYRMRKDEHMMSGLYDLVEYVNLPYESVIVELGSYRGESTEVWAKHYQDVTAIDPWSFIVTPSTMLDFMNNIQQHKEDIDWENLSTIFTDVEKSFDERMEPYSVTKLKMNSEDAVHIFDDGTIDLIYIDAMHDYPTVNRDIDSWKDKVKPGGFISGHDYADRWPGVIHAVEEHFGKPDAVFSDTSWVVSN